MYTDIPLVTSAPTGSGKTVIFELAIVRLLMQMIDNISMIKVVYGKQCLILFISDVHVVNLTDMIIYSAPNNSKYFRNLFIIRQFVQ